MDLVIRYDAKADILVVKLSEGKMVDEKLLDSDILLSFDEEGEPVVFEVWDASKRGLMKSLIDLANEKRGVVDTLLERETATPS